LRRGLPTTFRHWSVSQPDSLIAGPVLPNHTSGSRGRVMRDVLP
jgi:hypothetical protein